jgi:4-alpha-glucanotransferase
MPFVAEDLGDIDQDVYELRDKLGLPGMAILQFAFGKNVGTSVHSIHNHVHNCVVYTGTHDNNTSKGWFMDETSKLQRRNLKQYTGKRIRKKNCNREMIRLAYSSVSKLAIIPIQDFIGLGSNARINTPSVAEGNWTWRLSKKLLSTKIEKKILKMVKTFGRR